MGLGNHFCVSEVSSFFPFASFVFCPPIYSLMIQLELQLAAIWRGLVLVRRGGGWGGGTRH